MLKLSHRFFDFCIVDFTLRVRYSRSLKNALSIRLILSSDSAP